MGARGRIQFTLTTLIAWIVLGTALVLVTTLLYVVKLESNVTAIESSETLFNEISTKTIAKFNTVIASISTLTDMAALTFRVARTGTAHETFALDVRPMRAILDANPQLMSVYIGYEDGSFHQVIAPRNDVSILNKYEAPSNTVYIDRIIAVTAAGSRGQTWRFLDAALNEIGSRADQQVDYDPRTRPWFVDARKHGRGIYTAPYVFSSSKLPGLTRAQVLADGGAVFGVDVTLAQLGNMLAEQQVLHNGVVWIVDRANRLVAYPGLTWAEVLGQDLLLPAASEAFIPLVRAVARKTDQAKELLSGRPFFLDMEDEAVMASATPMSSENGLGLCVVVAAPLRDITGHIGRMVWRIVLIAAGLLAFIVPVSILMARRASRPFGGLVREAEKIQRFDFSPSPPVTSSITEVQELACACEVMKSTIQSKTERLVRTQEKLRMLVEGGVALAAEKRLDRLVTLIFRNAKELAHADGGVLYLKEGEELGVEILSLGCESLVLGGLSENPVPRVMVRPAIMNFLSQDSVLRSACEAFNTRGSVIVGGRELSLFPTGLPREPKDYPIRSLIAVPIVTRRDEVLGVIQLFNPREKDCGAANDGRYKEMSDFVDALAAQAAVTLDNRNLVNSMRELFDALVQVIAASIDAKSPYTAGHCTRVPELAEMLARAANDTEEGALRDFRLETDDEWRQLFIAAWLHDCGKVTTPEYVVDKATKLETIYNRIHEVRLRFEVLRRDLEVGYYRALARDDTDHGALRDKLEEEFQRLDDDYAFVAQCNIGGEFMTDAAKERLRQIAGRVWLRHFSDRLGVSADELRAKDDKPEPQLPTPEFLLADKPEHIVPRTKDYSHIVDAHGEPISVPDHEYNRGEIYNLCIPRGTLTLEERFKIREHTLSGIEMLKRIPFPEHLCRVPEIATGHHETLIGTGYPLRKSKDHLSVEARILAIADIFEALTASDRPYKPAKTLSEALRIMSSMRDDQLIDAELFDIFLKKDISRLYAERRLHPWQNNVKDISIYLSSGK